MAVSYTCHAKEALELLRLPQGGVAVDGTLGLAGHAFLMAQALGPQRTFDRDRSRQRFFRAG